MKSNPQSGNAVVWALMAIALFAALTATIMQGSRNSTAIMSDEEARSYAKQAIAYANDVHQATKRLILRGCSPEEISFDNVTGWTPNPLAPTNKTCHVFEPEGGGLQYRDLPDNAYTQMPDGYNSMAWMAKIDDVGDDARSEIIWSTWYMKKDVCIKINELIGIENPDGEPPEDDLDESDYDDDFADGIDDTLPMGIGDDEAGLVGKKSFCFYNDIDLYGYLIVLVVR